LIRYLIVGGPLQLPHGFSASPPIGVGARLPSFLPNDNNLIIFGLPAGVYRVHTGLIIGIAALALVKSLIPAIDPAALAAAVRQAGAALKPVKAPGSTG
jgi:hypothetical protein